MNKPLVVIVGPTASGKSALGMEAAKRFNGEIICADSRTVYKGMDIGTAKPTLTDCVEVRHHLLDMVEPDEIFTVVDFKRLALKAIDDITARGKLPILVGGTGLYIDAILFDYDFGAASKPTTRARLLKKSVTELQKCCIENNINLPLNLHNKRHLVRAIELGGLLKNKKLMRENVLLLGITIDRIALRRRVIRRAQSMLDAGLLDELNILTRRYSKESEAMKANSYRAVTNVIENTTPFPDILTKIVKKDMGLAKRQITWFKRNPAILWAEDTDELLIAIQQFVKT